jgi:ADP-ribose pyrophosphatase YjhB (NUDIX family)
METVITASDIYEKKHYCTNCGKVGHVYKSCRDPIVSYGIIAIQLSFEQDMLQQFITLTKRISCSNKIICNSETDPNKFSFLKDSIKFLMIQRKFSLCFIEFIRGKYRHENKHGLTFLFKQMVPSEIQLIKTHSFEALWCMIWNDIEHKLTITSHEYIEAKHQYDLLCTYTPYSLNYYIDNIKPYYHFTEWGFPKGRRKRYEKNVQCAVREFEEESGYMSDEYILLDHVDPVEETFCGTNGIMYKHIYYIAIITDQKDLSQIVFNSYQEEEIQNIQLLSYTDASQLIRPYHNERRYLLTFVYSIMMNLLMHFD